MTTLVINDLAVSKELDSKAMAGVSGGMFGGVEGSDGYGRGGFGGGIDIFSPDVWTYSDPDNVYQANNQYLNAPTIAGDRSVQTPINYQFGINASTT